MFSFVARVLVAVGMAWRKHLAVFAMCISASLFVTTELVSIQEALALTLVGAACRWVKCYFNVKNTQSTITTPLHMYQFV